jgi:hypothetical protein
MEKVTNLHNFRGLETGYSVCKSWELGKECTFDKERERGCRFAHSCVNKKCIEGKSVDHFKKDCPN